jgi:hypothetical protein
VDRGGQGVQYQSGLTVPQRESRDMETNLGSPQRHPFRQQ